MNLLISACLMGVKCRYDGKTKPLACLGQLTDEYTLIPVCPEVLGGLPTPRVPAERIGDRVITQDGRDVTSNYEQGAQQALRMAQMTGCTTALLKERSPSCGSGMIYDGTFSGGLCSGDGVCGALLRSMASTFLGKAVWRSFFRSVSAKQRNRMHKPSPLSHLNSGRKTNRTNFSLR